MAKFEKFKALKAKAKAKAQLALATAKEKGHPALNHGLRYGAHGVLGLAQKASGAGLFGYAFLKPDVIGTALLGITSILPFVKGTTRKGFRAGAYGGGHAILGRWIAAGEIKIISGPDGKGFRFA